MIKDSFLELDGNIDDKSNDDGTHDLYFVEIEDNDKEIIADFITWHGGNQNNQEHDKYRVNVEYIDYKNMDLKEKLIAALIKELGDRKGRPKRIRKVVERFLQQ